MLRVSQDNDCLFSEFDALEMLDKLLEKEFIRLSKSKHP